MPISKSELLDALLQHGIQDLAEAFETAEVSDRLEICLADPNHPLHHTAYHAIDPDSTSLPHESFLRVFRGISEINAVPTFSGWLGRRLEEACTTNGYSTASGALGEIRAASSLLSAFPGKVAPIPQSRQKTPDFAISLENASFDIEVKTKWLNDEEECRYREFANKPVPSSHSGISTQEHWVFPAGRPRQSETSAENVSSKIAGVGTQRSQARPGIPVLLWLDLCSQWWALSRHQLCPYMQIRGMLSTPGVWHAFYGDKGTPAMDECHLTKSLCLNCNPLGFDGIFRKQPRWAGAIIEIPTRTVAWINPWCDDAESLSTDQ